MKLNLKNLALGALVMMNLGDVMAAENMTLAGCSSAKFVNGSDNNTIATVGASYTPKCLRVKVGATITIEASQHHPLSAMRDVGNAQNPFANGARYVLPQTRKMTTPGLYGYFCEVHGDADGDGMAGAILVEAE